MKGKPSPKVVEDRLAAALALVRAGKKWEARPLLLDELRASTDRRAEVLGILDKHFPLSDRQRKALAELPGEGHAAALDVMLDAPDPRFTAALVARAEDEPKALEALLSVREAYAADALEDLYPEPRAESVARAVEAIRSRASEPRFAHETPPPPPADVPEDRLWGLVDEVRMADKGIYGSSEPELKSTAKKKPTSRKVRRARP